MLLVMAAGESDLLCYALHSVISHDSVSQQSVEQMLEQMETI